ncbi:MAG: hypothetical protein K2L12_07575 [Clostridia bacterium]|nr:hypothetical protein [Clostridia bacterium]
MRKKYLTARYGITALCVMLIALCLALGVWFVGRLPVYAEETSQPVADEEQTAPEKAQNYWEVTPNLVSWKWGEFDSKINKISGKAAYGNDTLQFMIWHLTDGSGKEIDEGITYDGYDGLIFKLDEKGEMPAPVIEKLKTLDYGTYSLIANVSESETATGLGESDPVKGFTFNVLKGENRWTYTPHIVSWNWGEFKAGTNTITAVPAYIQEGERVKFSVYKGVSFADPKLSSFYTVNGNMSNGAVEGDVEKALKSLDAGNYTLRAYVAGTENYDSLETVAQFTVRQVRNYWTTAPSVLQWTWSEYNPEVNVITAVPAYHPANTAQVVYGIYKDKECKVPVEDNGLLENFLTVTQSRAEVISGLNAGTYYLQAETRYGSGNYTDLRTVIPFTVQTIQNRWTTTPNVVQWKYGEYDPAVNVIMASPRFENGAVTYGIYTDAAHTTAVEGLENFTEVNSDIAAKLDALNVGTYYLYASVAQAGNSGQRPNFAKLETQTAVEFRISPLQNYWTGTPSVLSWKYGDYSKNVNLISAVPAEGGSARISIYDGEGIIIGFVNSENTTVTSFELVPENGAMLVPDYVEKRLKGLDAGTYYMLASVEESDNYTGINNYTTPEEIKQYAIKFDISAITNVWTSIPKMSSWREGHFSNENKVSAEAAFGNDTAVIIVYDSDGKVVTSNQNNTQLDYDKIAALGVGLYKVSLSIGATGNYSELTAEIEFSVMEDSVALSGIIAVTIAFAALDVIAAGTCIALIIIRRRKIEERFRQMVQKELHGGNK